ncbi:NAD(P)-dependent dehydrogenase (short-subunit alcohol dehydrogenase family) [Paenibacillus castaneae]|uniref:SDR family NAD(P)-dependent oxidoreductase n=1 Tax=Paenibacillus castaneae TaxID=474957 RepID=UPI000C9A4287|nr:SDR family oxidoreductase [Paenibacillus castaneae]NIK76742.1 NAD(P)-dependent dehydrogenase (short-subunit alcohol dehydrogenase family) [Paenibacillus castaneae]
MILQNKVVFLTDADNETGRAIVRKMIEAGAHMILNSPSGGRSLSNELSRMSEAGLQAIVVQIDLCKSAVVAEMLQLAEQKIGAVDVFIHNSKFIHRASIEACEEDDFMSSLSDNAKSAFICTQAVGKQMMQKQTGKIIYVSSIHAEKPTGSAFAFSASKGAVKMLSKEAALVLGRFGISVNTIEFGPVEGDNELFQSSLSTLYNDYEYKVPNAILGTHEDLAELILFLSSDDARYINGADIRLDGGFLLHYMNFKMKRP